MNKIALGAITLALVLILSQTKGISGGTKTLVHVNDDNWSQILEGEWMVEFYAPWCPACRSLQPVWEEFSGWGNDLGIQVGQVDITNSPGLSGRFMITALPTIYHIKEGSFRQYKGPRSKEEFLSFVEEKKWESLEPISSWQSPSSLQMTVVSQFYKVSMGLRTVMNVMLEEYGIPAWAAYLLFGVGTIVIGLILGVILVFIIDYIYPPGPPRPVPTSPSPRSEGKDKDSDDEFTEEIQDDESQAENEEAEALEKDSSEAGGGDVPAASRRRKARRE